MSSFIHQQLDFFSSELRPYGAKLIAVSKTKPVELIKEAMDWGQVDFGENKVQEAQQKSNDLPKNLNWHLIGHLQTNKVKQALTFSHLIHAVDSEKLLKEINKEAGKKEQTAHILLQIHIAQEETKFGWDEEEVKCFLGSGGLNEFPNIKIKGLMGMASLTDNTQQIEKEFKGLFNLKEWCKANVNSAYSDWQELSMGMSGDYKIALENGSTMIRIGTAIFGGR